MSDTYTREEFAICFQRRGYGTRKQAREWMDKQRRVTFCESDFEACWRALNGPKPATYRGKYIAVGFEVNNISDPEYMPNSKGRSFETEMKMQQRLTSNLDASIKRRAKEDGEE